MAPGSRLGTTLLFEWNQYRIRPGCGISLPAESKVALRNVIRANFNPKEKIPITLAKLHNLRIVKRNPGNHHDQQSVGPRVKHPATRIAFLPQPDLLDSLTKGSLRA